MVTESPSPDTKLRFDLGTTLNEDPRDNGAKIEGEFAFSPALSLSIVGTHAWQSGVAGERSNSIELALKGASFAIAHRGMLFGGGLGLELPLDAGRSRKEDPSIEPFVDWALKKGALQLVTMAAYSASMGDNVERRLQLNGSALVGANTYLEFLGEIEIVNPLSGEDPTTVQVAPGLKVRPWMGRDLAIGMSAPFGISNSTSRSLLLSMFYHF